MWDEIVGLLKEAGAGCLATVENGKPRNRPWGGPLAQDGKLYFCTGTFKEVYKQLAAEPYIEFCSNIAKGKWVRIRGKIDIIDDLAVKTMFMEAMPGLKDVYQAPEHPSFGVFVMEHGEAILGDFARDVKAPPITWQF
ncbi:MAG: pyridoxamine 5'-phosphate oxidase family protein [Clostridiales bacterium]|jgi:uncharacterized pyridoxamine 5'-phosphate oxidase family protein|nr:pyridoxamine 5'-phosphate oxidase family protein [Clostridiales bacterium]